MNREEWGKWFRDNSDKFLLFIGLAGVLGVTLHIMHHQPSDDTQLQFINGVTNTLLGAFITLITGAVMRKSSSASTTTQDPSTGAAVVATAKEEDK